MTLCGLDCGSFCFGGTKLPTHCHSPYHSVHYCAENLILRDCFFFFFCLTELLPDWSLLGWFYYDYFGSTVGVLCLVTGVTELESSITAAHSAAAPKVTWVWWFILILGSVGVHFCLLKRTFHVSYMNITKERPHGLGCILLIIIYIDKIKI